MLSPSLTGWQSQYERMKRARARLSKSYESSIDYDDDLQHFFQDCWHLKDWLKNDRSVNHLTSGIENEVKAYKALMVAADLATGSKHLERRCDDRTGAYVTSKDVTAHLGQARSVDVVHTVTLKDGTTVTATAVAKGACEAWDRILCKLGLI